MKKFMFVFSLLLVFSIVAVNQADAQSVSSKAEMAWGVDVPCANDGAGEWVSGTLVLHTVIHSNKRGIVTKVHYQPQSSSLTGQITGMVFKANGVTQTMYSNLLGGGAYTYTFINRYHIVGNGIQFYVKQTVHYTVNANGILTADVDNFSVECK